MSYLGDAISAQAAGSSASLTLRGGFEYQVRIGGTFGGATVTVEIYDDQIAEWVAASDEVTAARAVNLITPSGTEARITVTGGTSPSINANFVLLRNH